MRFQKHESTVISASTPEKVSEFGIRKKDMVFVLSILRDKMYSDPMGAICREIACNARDAHREAGIPDTPIEIYLPSATSPHIEFVDFGPGINPTRMEDIFINYGASTKRKSNQQTGGFGLGAKTPFAYTDTFSVVTVWNGKKREYTAFIDDSRHGLLHLVRTSDTDEPTGTRIIVPVTPYDNDRFITKAVKATKYWSVKPKFHGLSKHVVSDEPLAVLLEDEDYIIFDNNKTLSSDKFALVDEIPYDFKIHDVIEDSEELQHLKFKHMCLKFNTGEVIMTPNRESLQLDDYTKKSLLKKLVAVNEKLVKQAFEKVDRQQYLDDAEYALMGAGTIIGTKNIPDEYFWNDVKLRCSTMRKAGKLDEMQIIKYFWKTRRSGQYIESDTVSHLELDCKIIVDHNWEIDDDGKRKFLHGRNTITRYVRHYMQKVAGGASFDDVYYVVRFHNDATEQKWLDQIKYLNPANVIDFANLPKPPRKRGGSRRHVERGSIDAYCLNRYYLGNYDQDRYLKPEIIEKDGEGVYIISFSKSKRHFGAGDLKIDSIFSLPLALKSFYESVTGESLKIHVVSKRFEKTLGDDWVRLDDFIKENVEDLFDKVDVRMANTHAKVKRFQRTLEDRDLEVAMELDKEFAAFLEKIKDIKAPPFIKLIAESVGFDLESYGRDEELCKEAERFKHYFLLDGYYGKKRRDIINLMIDYRRLKDLEKDGGLSETEENENVQLNADELQQLNEAV